MLRFDNGEYFSKGLAKYIYRPVTQQESSPRINLQVEIGGIQTLAFVDTGAPYVVCKPEIAAAIGLDQRDGEPFSGFILRGFRLDGSLHRMTVTILAEEGDNLSVDATVFVPDSKPSLDWSILPSILGLTGFLERIRFAVDPNEDKFYFCGLS